MNDELQGVPFEGSPPCQGGVASGRGGSRDFPRVCFLIALYHPYVGGAESHARMLTRELLAMGVPVQVLTRRITRDLPREDHVDGVPVRRVPPAGSPRWGKYLMMPAALLSLIRHRRDYDIIYVCSFRVLGLLGVLAGRLLGKPVVLRGEACGELSGEFIWQSFHRPRAAPPAWLKGVLRHRNRYLLKAEAFVCLSSVIADELRANGVPDAKNHLIYSGLDLQRFKPAGGPDDKARLRRELGLPPDQVLAAYSGKLIRGKGLERLLRVWRQVWAPGKPWRLVLIGSGSQQFMSCEAELREYVRAHGLGDSVIFTGYVDGVQRYLQAMDFFIFPSERESLGLALVEALACELPALASRIPGVTDIVTDGQDGGLVTVDNEAEWAQRLRDLLEHPDKYRAWGPAGRATVLRKFSMSACAAEHLALFEKLMARP